MIERDRAATVARAAAVVSVGGLLAVLGWYLRAPGYGSARLVLFALLGASAVLGLAGVVTGRRGLLGGGVAALVVLGGWQAVLWRFVAAGVAALVLAALVDDRDRAVSARTSR
jgi:hypothetical protein